MKSLPQKHYVELLKATMESSMHLIQVLESIRDKKGKIIDFRWTLSNPASEKIFGDVIGKTLLQDKSHSVDDKLFDIYERVVETGVAHKSDRHYIHDHINRWFIQSTVKLNDGVAITATDITDLKNRDEEIRDHKYFIAQVAETVPDMISVIDFKTKTLLYLNRVTFTQQGFDRSNILGKSKDELRTLTHPDDRKVVDDYYERLGASSDHEIVETDYRAVKNGDAWQWYHARGKVFSRGENGEVLQIVNVVENITERKKAELEIKEGRDLLQSIINAPTLGIAVYKALRNDEGKIIDFVHEFINKTTVEALGRNFTGELLSSHGPSGIMQLDKFIDAIENKRPVSYVEYAEFNGGPHWIAFTNTPLHGDRLVHMWEDITKEKESEAEVLRIKDQLAQNVKDKYSLLFNTLNNGYTICEGIRDQKGKMVDCRFVEVNPAFEKITGLKPELTIGKTVKEILPAFLIDWLDIHQNLIDTKQPSRKESYITSLRRWYDITAFYYNEDSFALYFTDITERKQEQERQLFSLKLSDALRSLNDPILVRDMATKLVGEYLGTEYSYYHENDADGWVFNRSSYSSGLDVVVSDIRLDERFTEEERNTWIKLGIVSSITVPLHKDGKQIAAFSVTNQVPRNWISSDVKLLEDVIERTWAAVERAKAEQTALINEERMRAIKDAYQSVANGGKIENSLKRLTELVVQETTGEARCTFYLVNPERSHLNPINGCGNMPDEYLNEINEFPIGEDSLACGRVVPTGEAIITADVFKEPSWTGWTHIAEKYNYRACWSFPIKTREDKAVGTFTMYFEKVRNPGERELSLADVVTRTAAVVISNHYDNVDRTRAENLLKEANAQLKEMDVAKTNFFNNVSHEFRTPLTLLISPLEEVIQSASSKIPHEQLQKLNISHRGALRLQKLVNTLLDFARIEAGKLETFLQPTDFTQITIDLASNFRSAIEKAGLRFIIKTEPINESIYLNREMWEKIVLNLLSNAFKFTQNGKIEVIIRNKKKTVEFRVKDTGVGIATKNLSRIFERFARIEVAQARTFEGTGIGLALVRELVLANGGSIKVQSKEGIGSEFIVSIPKGKDHLLRRQIYESKINLRGDEVTTPFIDEISGWRQEGEKRLSHSQIQDKNNNVLRILIAEDNADMRDYLVSVLLEDKYNIQAFSDGHKVLKFLREGGSADLILTDVMMPLTDGYELVQWLKADSRFSHIPIILLSAKASEEEKIEGIKLGADAYLVKPFSAKELRAVILSKLKQPRST